MSVVAASLKKTPTGNAKPLAGTLVTFVTRQLSVTGTVKVHVLELPVLSRAVLVTVVVPSGKARPLAVLLVMLVTAQLSVAFTMKVTLLAHSPGAVLTVIFPGQLIAGG